MKLKKMERRLLELFVTATDDQQQRGIDWYPNARRIVQDLAELCGISPEQAAATIAALSPRLHWKRNIDVAAEVASTKQTHGVFGANVIKALRILNRENPREVLRGPKVTAFFANLCGDDNAVTIDTHMLKACGHHRVGCSPKQYATMATAVANAAQVAGLPSAHFQAVIWIVVRENYSEDF